MHPPAGFAAEYLKRVCHTRHHFFRSSAGVWRLPEDQLVQNALALVSGTSTGYLVLQDHHLLFGLITAGSGALAAECHLIIRRTARYLEHFATFSVERPT